MNGIKITLNPKLREQVAAIKENLETSYAGLLFDTTVEMHWRVSRRTPVDKGRARGNWRVGINAPDLYMDWEERDPSGKNSQAEAKEIARNIKAGDKIFITNAVPYVRQLNRGSSRKAPAGFIEQTAAELPFVVRKIVQGWGGKLHGREQAAGVGADQHI